MKLMRALNAVLVLSGSSLLISIPQNKELNHEFCSPKISIQEIIDTEALSSSQAVSQYWSF
jgi:hypothetical protein